MQNMSSMTTFDFITAHVVFFIMIYYVYAETPFRSDIDYVFKKYFDLIYTKTKTFFETVAGLNTFLLLDYEDYEYEDMPISSEEVEKQIKDEKEKEEGGKKSR